MNKSIHNSMWEEFVNNLPEDLKKALQEYDEKMFEKQKKENGQCFLVCSAELAQALNNMNQITDE